MDQVITLPPPCVTHQVVTICFSYQANNSDFHQYNESSRAFFPVFFKVFKCDFPVLEQDQLLAPCD